MDALHMLTEDHYEMRQTLSQILKTHSNREKRQHFWKLSQQVKEHLGASGEFLYPEALKTFQNSSVFSEELELHQKLKRFMHRLSRNFDDRDFTMQLNKFILRIKALLEREENSIFPQIWHHLPHLKLLHLGMLIQQHRDPSGLGIDQGDLGDEESGTA